MDMAYNALVLNADFTPISVHPLSVWDFKRTLRNKLKDRIIVLEEYDVTFRSQTFEYTPPSVVALKDYVKRPRKVAFSRLNIFLRDEFTCQYCGEKFHSGDLTFDHVLPRAHGGKTSFENIATACVPCNQKKGSNLGILPKRTPFVPTPEQLEKARGRINLKKSNLHETWHDYLYWSGVLEKDE